MKILIVSDTHRKHEALKKVLKKEQPVDMMIHLGDVEGYEDYIRTLAGCPTEMVAGNNDFFSELEREKEIKIGNYNILLTHGHYYQVSLGAEFIMEDAAARGFDIVMFGHTHRPVLIQENGITALNPGSLSYPRQENRRASYIIMKIDPQGRADYRIGYL